MRGCLHKNTNIRRHNRTHMYVRAQTYAHMEGEQLP